MSVQYSTVQYSTVQYSTVCTVSTPPYMTSSHHACHQSMTWHVAHRPLCTVNDDIYDDDMIFIYGRAVVDL